MKTNHNLNQDEISSLEGKIQTLNHNIILMKAQIEEHCKRLRELRYGKGARK